MLIHGMKTTEQGAEVFRTDRNHRGEPDGRIHGIASSNPIPESEHVGGVDAEGRDLLGIGRDSDKVTGDGLDITAESLEQPVAGTPGIGHRLQRCEGLRRDDKEGLRGIEIMDSLCEVGAIHVGDES